jgi:hypothetical protein
MTVHIWTKEGTYVGEVLAGRPFSGLDFGGIHEDHREKIKQALTGMRGPGSSDFIQVQGLGEKILPEFPNEQWIAVASVLLLPPAGYRVHAIVEPIPREV